MSKNKKHTVDRSKLSKEDFDRYTDGGILTAVPDHNFSEKRSRSIIEETIKETDANYIERRKKIDEGIQERSDVIYSYIKSGKANNSSHTIDKYLGKKLYMKLLGNRRIKHIQSKLAERLLGISGSRKGIYARA